MIPNCRKIPELKQAKAAYHSLPEMRQARKVTVVSHLLQKMVTIFQKVVTILQKMITILQKAETILREAEMK